MHVYIHIGVTCVCTMCQHVCECMYMCMCVYMCVCVYIILTFDEDLDKT